MTIFSIFVSIVTILSLHSLSANAASVHVDISKPRVLETSLNPETIRTHKQSDELRIFLKLQFPDLCPVGVVEPIWEGDAITEAYCRCPGGTYGFNCGENFVNPCLNTQITYSSADPQVPPNYFIKCNNRTPYLIKCAKGTVWNQSITTCDWDQSGNVLVSRGGTADGYSNQDKSGLKPVSLENPYTIYSILESDMYKKISSQKEMYKSQLEYDKYYKPSKYNTPVPAVSQPIQNAAPYVPPVSTVPAVSNQIMQQTIDTTLTNTAGAQSNQYAYNQQQTPTVVKQPEPITVDIQPTVAYNPISIPTQPASNQYSQTSQYGQTQDLNQQNFNQQSSQYGQTQDLTQQNYNQQAGQYGQTQDLTQHNFNQQAGQYGKELSQSSQAHSLQYGQTAQDMTHMHQFNQQLHQSGQYVQPTEVPQQSLNQYNSVSSTTTVAQPALNQYGQSSQYDQQYNQLNQNQAYPSVPAVQPGQFAYNQQQVVSVNVPAAEVTQPSTSQYAAVASTVFPQQTVSQYGQSSQYGQTQNLNQQQQTLTSNDQSSSAAYSNQYAASQQQPTVVPEVQPAPVSQYNAVSSSSSTYAQGQTLNQPSQQQASQYGQMPAVVQQVVPIVQPQPQLPVNVAQVQQEQEASGQYGVQQVTPAAVATTVQPEVPVVQQVASKSGKTSYSQMLQQLINEKSSGFKAGVIPNFAVTTPSTQPTFTMPENSESAQYSPTVQTASAGSSLLEQKFNTNQLPVDETTTSVTYNAESALNPASPQPGVLDAIRTTISSAARATIRNQIQNGNPVIPSSVQVVPQQQQQVPPVTSFQMPYQQSTSDLQASLTDNTSAGTFGGRSRVGVFNSASDNIGLRYSVLDGSGSASGGYNAGAVAVTAALPAHSSLVSVGVERASGQLATTGGRSRLVQLLTPQVSQTTVGNQQVFKINIPFDKSAENCEGLPNGLSIGMSVSLF